MINKRKRDFKKLSLRQKKQKLLMFLSKLEKNDKIFTKLIVTIQKHKNISEKFFEDIYFDLMDFSELIKESNAKKNQDKLVAIGKHMKDLSSKEEKERLMENADSILDQI